MTGYTGFVMYLLAGALICSLTVQGQNIRGTPGVDYPNYFSIPKTSFKCSDQKYIPGFYADMETDCQVFHFCYGHRHESFLCPTGTTFNQPILACDSWYNSNCSLTPLYYIVNAGPGIKNAGKNIPMLLRRKDRIQGTTTTMASTSHAFEELTSLFESSTEQETKPEGNPEVLGSENLANETNAGNVTNEFESEVLHDTLPVNADDSHSEHQITNTDAGKDQSAGQLETDIEEFQPVQNPGESILSGEDFHSEQTETDLVFDPITDEYKGGYSSDEWKDESEHNSQFQKFYEYGGSDFGNQMMQNDESAPNDGYQNFYKYGNEFNQMRQNDAAQVQDGYIGKYSSIQNEYSRIQNDADLEKQRNLDEIEFAKRYMQRQFPKRSRRRPTYVVVDTKPEDGIPQFSQSMVSYVESTESPFTESISIDSLVDEINTEFPEEYEENVDSFDVDTENVNIDESLYSEIPEFQQEFDEGSNLNTQSELGIESDTISESEDGSKVNAETSVIDSGPQLDKLVHGEETSHENIKFKGEDQYVYSKESFVELDNPSVPLDKNDSVEVLEEEESEDIQIYDDSDDPVVPEESEIEEDIQIYDDSEDPVVPDEREIEEDIQIYDDSDNPVVPEEAELEDVTVYDGSNDPVVSHEESKQVEPNASNEEEKYDTFVIIPDETNSPQTFEDADSVSEGAAYDTVSGSVDPNWEYAEVGESSQNEGSENGYMDGDRNDQTGFSQDARYMYEDPGVPQTDQFETQYVYEDMNMAGQQMEGSEARYVYEDESEMQPIGAENVNSYTNANSQKFIPENYYQYVPENEYSNSQYGVPDVPYRTSAEGIPGGRYNVPAGMYSYGISNDGSYSYGYAQPDMQQAGYVNNYPYSPEISYPYGNRYAGEYPEYPESVETPSAMHMDGNVSPLKEASETADEFDQVYSESPESWDRFSSTEGSVAVEYQTEEIPVTHYISDGSSENEVLNADTDFKGSNLKDVETSEGGMVNNAPKEETYYVFDFDEDADQQTVETAEELTSHGSTDADLDAFEATDQNFDGNGVSNEWKEASDSNDNASSRDIHSSQFSEESSSEDSGKSKTEHADSQSEVGEENFEKHPGSELGKTGSMSGGDSNKPLDAWLSQTFANDPDDEKPVTLSSALERLAGLKPTKAPPRADFISPTETQYSNTMGLPNTMNFAPYGYGVNTGHQFGMMDSTNAVPFSKTVNKPSDQTGKPSSSRLSKLSSLQEKVRSMKRGKFGMFKKYMNTMKNQDEENFKF